MSQTMETRDLTVTPLNLEFDLNHHPQRPAPPVLAAFPLPPSCFLSLASWTSVSCTSAYTGCVLSPVLIRSTGLPDGPQAACEVMLLNPLHR